jgi:SpoIID/LytB domain protein
MFDITKEDYCVTKSRRYAHKECYDKYYNEDDDKVEDIYTFLREEVLITCDRAQCERQRKNFITKFGYTNEGILKALKYFYKVKKQSPEKSGNRIGIVPYVYNEAKAYYESLEKRQKLLTKTAVEQMKKKWGSSFNTYYNKVKNAVESTKGKVLTYNGGYIEAAYYAISNGKSELPKYVWSSTYPYLQAVSSNWDKDLSVGRYTVKLTYEKVSEKLGLTVSKETEFTVVSKTEGDRIAEIKVGDTVFSGDKFRNKLGLRSTDFEITKTDTGLTITTHGYGHGVGMSQYGANGAAKAGYTYTKILNHYYPGATLGSI